MALLIMLAAFLALGAVGAWLGADSRPSGGEPPEQQWPFIRLHH